MQNTGNTCYVNATLQSLVAVLGEDDTSAELEPLLHHCSNHNQEQRPLNPTGLFSLRSLMPRWKFDGRQQDAAEFLTFLLQGNTGTLQPVDWQGRTDGIPEAEDQGLTPLVLPLTRVCVTLQQACTAWCNHIHQRGPAWAPDILPVVIARWTDGVKNIRRLDLRQCLSLPTWGAARTRHWHTYEVRSGVYHIGDTLNAGHFRPFWFYPGRGVLHVGDDAVRPKPGKGQGNPDKDVVCHLCKKKGRRKSNCWYAKENGGMGKPPAPKEHKGKGKGGKGKPGKPGKGKAHSFEGEGAEGQEWPEEEQAEEPTDHLLVSLPWVQRTKEEVQRMASTRTFGPRSTARATQARLSGRTGTKKPAEGTT
eukprot:s1021_g11.t1